MDGQGRKCFVFSNVWGTANVLFVGGRAACLPEFCRTASALYRYCVVPCLAHAGKITIDNATLDAYQERRRRSHRRRRGALQRAEPERGEATLGVGGHADAHRTRLPGEGLRGRGKSPCRSAGNRVRRAPVIVVFWGTLALQSVRLGAVRIDSGFAVR